MYLVKVNDYKYQVIKEGTKNMVTLPYEKGMIIDIYESESQSEKNYVDIDSVEVNEYQKLVIDIPHFNDHIISLELYVDDDKKITYTNNEMQATIDEINDSQEDTDYIVKNNGTDAQDVLTKIKLSENQIVKNLELLEKVSSNKNDLEEISNYKNYLSAGKIKRKLFSKVGKTQKLLSPKLQLKFDAVLAYSSDVAEILLNSKYTPSEKEMIIDYVIVSKHVIDTIEYEFTKKNIIKSDEKVVLGKFITASREFFNLLAKNAVYTNIFIGFIGGKLPVLEEISATGLFEEKIFVDMTEEAKNNKEKLEDLIRERAKIKYNTIK